MFCYNLFLSLDTDSPSYLLLISLLIADSSFVIAYLFHVCHSILSEIHCPCAVYIVS